MFQNIKYRANDDKEFNLYKKHVQMNKAHSNVLIPIFKANPIIIKQDNKNEPPAEINGRGRPFTGIKPTAIAVLTKIWERKIVPIPIKIRLENLSLDSKANLII